MRILHVVAPSPFGGLERVVQALGAAQQSAGEDTHVAVVADAAGDATSRAFAEPLEHAGVAVHPVVAGARGYRRERVAIADLCRRTRPDVVHTHGYRADVVDAAPARDAGVPTASTLHGFTAGPARNRCYEWLQRRALRRSGAIAAVSAPIVERLVAGGVARRRVRLVPNAWVPSYTPLVRGAARRALGIPDGVFRAGWVGRVSREKGLDVMLEALAHLDQSFGLSVIGTGPELAGLQRYARHAGLAPRVTWHGMVPKAERVLAAFDVLVISSRTEGTPMILLEAMGASVPVVATAVGGIPDVVGAGEATVVEPGSPLAIAAAVCALRQRPEEAARRAQMARLRLERNYSAARWVEDYRALYAAAIAARDCA